MTVGINALLALSIWLTLACGMLSIGNAAFMGIGAYASALVTMKLGWPFPLALLDRHGAAGGDGVRWSESRRCGSRASTSRWRRSAFGEVVRILILNWDGLISGSAHVAGLLGLAGLAAAVATATDWTGGALGLNGIPPLTQWWHVLLALVLTVLVLWRVRRSKVGRAFEAIKEDDTAAGLMGIDVAATKMLAFVLGAAVAGLAGGLDAHLTFFIGPQEFGFDRGVDILTMAILGGIGGLPGPIVGAAILSLLPELLRSLRDFRLVVNGLILVLIVLFLPEGIWDPQRFRAWFRLTPRRAPIPSADAAPPTR